MPSVRIEAPEDAFLAELAPAGQVAAQQTIAVFKSPILDRLATSLKAMKDHVSVLERPFNDGRIDAEIQMYNDKVAVFSDAVIACQKVLDIELARYDAGIAAPELVPKAAISLSNSKASLIEAKIAASQAGKKKDDLQEQINIAKRKLDREEDFLLAMEKSLTVVSPSKGRFEPAILTSSFLKKGHLVGQFITNASG